MKMCERLSYLDGENRPSGMSSTPAVAKTLCDIKCWIFANGQLS